MGFILRLLGIGNNKRDDKPVIRDDRNRSFVPYQKRKNPDAKRNNKYGPKKD